MLAAALTGRDYLIICTCLQDKHTRVELMRLFVSAGKRNKRLSDIRKGRGGCYVIMTGQFARGGERRWQDHSQSTALKWQSVNNYTLSGHS